MSSLKSFEDFKNRYSYPFPACPKIADIDYPSYHAEEMFCKLLKSNFNLVVEIGVLYGTCTKRISQLCPNANIIVIDNWSLHPKRPRRFRGYNPKEVFNRKTWEFKDRVFVMEGDSKEQLQELIQYDISPNLLYIDGLHCYEYVSYEMKTFHDRFPKAIICGDDWDMLRDEKDGRKIFPIQLAVTHFCERHRECRYRVYDHFSWSINGN